MASNFKLESEEVTDLIRGLRIADCMRFQDIDVLSTEKEDISIQNVKELTISDVLSCFYCNVVFVDAVDQRQHFKLDWHRYNLKQALSGLQPVAEDAFLRLADDVSSISGSDSESSTDGSDTEISELSEKSRSEKLSVKYNSIRHAKVFFENQEGKLVSVYRCLLQSKKDTPTQEQLVSSVFKLIENPKKWLIIMLGGGHFAAAIFENSTPIYHKTFHCYTVRAKQGGGQSSRDSRSGGSHPKSAGASLRRYNEQALVQHVQDIMTAWEEPIKQCQLVLYRATGPYNRGVLFGGKKAPFDKTDLRLRTIPFPTRRATFSEIKRVYDMLAAVETYGSADQFKNDFPRSTDKRQFSPRKVNIDSTEQLESFLKNEVEQHMGMMKEKHSPRKIDRCKARRSPVREIPGKDLRTSSESSCCDNNGDLCSTELTISFDHLEEYRDTVPESMKEKQQSERKKRKKLTGKQKLNLEKKKSCEELEEIRKKLVTSCKLGDKELLLQTLKLGKSLPSKEDNETGDKLTKEDFIECLNTAVSEDSKETLLHLAAAKCLPEFVYILMETGADPTLRNKQKLTPYIVAGDKETRNAFRSFGAAYPDKFDLRKANIPEPLTEEMEKELEERKKEKKKQKRIKEKIKKKENREKNEEEKDKERFLTLSDREKCALAAERRLVQSATANMVKAKPPVLSRCFQCGADITGKVPFEYGSNRFCSIPCLKTHRSKTNSYGVEI